MPTNDGLRYIDSDGHILEHPTAMPDYAPAKYRDRIWHIETDESGEECLVYNGSRTPANGLSAALRQVMPGGTSLLALLATAALAAAAANVINNLPPCWCCCRWRHRPARVRSWPCCSGSTSAPT